MIVAKHTNWEYHNCSCKDKNNPYSEAEEELKQLHEQYVYFQSYVRDLLQSLDAEQKLKDGFKGMGHNILTETSGKKRGIIRKLKEMLGEE
jgi:hypothetical protein